jgi:hypothetical protein
MKSKAPTMGTMVCLLSARRPKESNG